MNKLPIKLSFLVMMLSSAVADPILPKIETEQGEGPLVKGGLWEVTYEATEYGPRYQDGPVVEVRKSYRETECRATRRLSMRSWLVTSDGRAFASVGFAEGSSNSITTIYSGDFTGGFEELTTGYSYPVGVVQFGYRETLYHTRARYVRVGDCPADMKPGERRNRSTE